MAFVVQLILPVHDHIEIDVAIDDASAYSRPWKADRMRFIWQPDTELLEHLCESNRDLANIQRF